MTAEKTSLLGYLKYIPLGLALAFSKPSFAQQKPSKIESMTKKDSQEIQRGLQAPTLFTKTPDYVMFQSKISPKLKDFLRHTKEIMFYSTDQRVILDMDLDTSKVNILYPTSMIKNGVGKSVGIFLKSNLDVDLCDVKTGIGSKMYNDAGFYFQPNFIGQNYFNSNLPDSLFQKIGTIDKGINNLESELDLTNTKLDSSLMYHKREIQKLDSLSTKVDSLIKKTKGTEKFAAAFNLAKNLANSGLGEGIGFQYKVDELGNEGNLFVGVYGQANQINKFSEQSSTPVKNKSWIDKSSDFYTRTVGTVNQNMTKQVPYEAGITFSYVTPNKNLEALVGAGIAEETSENSVTLSGENYLIQKGETLSEKPYCTPLQIKSNKVVPTAFVGIKYFPLKNFPAYLGAKAKAYFGGVKDFLGHSKTEVVPEIETGVDIKF